MTIGAQTYSPEKGKTFLSGIFWQSLPADKSQHKRLIQEISKESGFDLIIRRDSSVKQVGFASTRQGAAVGMMSIAAMLSKSIEIEKLGRSVLIAIALGNNRYLYFAQKDGVTLPEGDLIDSDDEIRSHLLADLGGQESKFDAIVAPDHWSIPGAEERHLEDFLPRHKKTGKVIYKSWWQLRAIRGGFATKRNVALLCIAASVASASIWAHVQWKKHKQIEQLEQLRKIEALRRMQDLIHSPPPTPNIVHPWKTKPRATTLVNACVTAFGDIRNIEPAGWKLRDALCASGSLMVSWTRMPGTYIDQMQKAEPSVSFASDFNTATKVIPIKLESDPEEPLVPSTQREKELIDASGRAGIKFASNPPVIPSLPVTADQKTAPPKANWTEQTWSINASPLPPEFVIARLDGPGFRVDNLQFVISSGLLTYNFNGTQYANP